MVRLVGPCALVLAFVAGCKKDSPKPEPKPEVAKVTPADCEKLNAHIVDVTIKESVAQEHDLSDEAKQKLADELRAEMADDPAGKKMAAGCEKEFSRTELDCMMQASTTKGMDVCEGLAK